MKPITHFVAIVSMLFAQASLAEDTRFFPLQNSYLVANLERDGIWSVDFKETYIEYSCLKCPLPATAVLEAIAPYTSENYGSLSERYLSERKLFCAGLVTSGVGRCLGTSSIRMRGSALSGFQSNHVIANRREIEIVFFYHQREFGPELIRTKISIENGAELPDDALGIFREHMAKLTLFW